MRMYSQKNYGGYIKSIGKIDLNRELCNIYLLILLF